MTCHYLLYIDSLLRPPLPIKYIYKRTNRLLWHIIKILLLKQRMILSETLIKHKEIVSIKFDLFRLKIQIHSRLLSHAEVGYLCLSLQVKR